jgi:hypothetical protein
MLIYNRLEASLSAELKERNFLPNVLISELEIHHASR